jgi:geranylgeranyl diphosphate synthase, type I
MAADWLARKKPLIARELGRQVDQRRPGFARINAWGPDAARRLASFAVRGKMLRGGLLLLGVEMYSRRAASAAALKAAAALEIIHSSLLIHDDIMDNDRLRRGERTIFAQYEQLGRGRRAADPARFGSAMGICAGDVGYFLAGDILSSLPLPEEVKGRLLSLVFRELAHVGLAQMQDISFGASGRTPARDDVIALYLYKTARYTFSLPLAAGALIAGAPAAQQRRLWRLGEHLGVVFQVRDDDLGIFGSEEETGKPVGSDIREGKKTLLYLELFRKAKGAEKEDLAALFGKATLTRAEAARVRSAMERLGARETLDGMLHELAAEAQRIIRTLDISPAHAEVLRDICAKSLERKK